MILGYKEEGVCRLLRTVNDILSSNVVAPLSVYGTYTRILPTGSGKAIVMSEGILTMEQTLCCDPLLFDPKEKITEHYLHDVVRPHAIKLLKKRRQLGDNDELPPRVELLVVVGGVFYHLSVDDGDVEVDDRFYCSTLAEISTLLGGIEAKTEKGWDLLEKAAENVSLFETTTLYPLVRVDDHDFRIESKKNVTASWEVC